MKLAVRCCVVAGLAVSSVASARPESAEFSNVDSIGTVGSALNAMRSYTFTSSFRIGSITILGTLDQVEPDTYASEARIRISGPGGSVATATGGASLVERVFPQNEFSGSISTPVGGSPFGPGGLTGVRVSAGQTFDFRFYESYWDGAATSTRDAAWSSITVRFNEFTPPPAPTVIRNFGTLGNGFSPIAVAGATRSGEVDWYSFTAGSGNTFLDAWTALADSNTDTVLGLYDSDGFLLGTNDDYDHPDALWSHLGFGASTIDPDGLGALAPFGPMSVGGQAGMLDAGGTYYLAVAGFRTNFGESGFNVVPTVGSEAGPYQLNIVPGPTGSVALVGGGLIMVCGRRRGR